jgi:hypothetical protein
MTTKTSMRPLVDFFASTRLAHMFRSAARRNKRLAKCGTIHEFGRVASLTELLGRVHELEMVVLSHADDDHLALTGSEIEPIVSGAFHLLFTEPTTHPEQVAQWIRTTNIRAENRLHIVRVDDLEAPQVSDLLARVCSAFRPEGSRGNIVDACLGGDALLVRGPKHRMLHVPTDKLSSLRGQPRGVLRNFRIDPDGSFIYWPDIDVHLGWNQFLQAVDPEELRKAQQRSMGFNERYGAAIRKLREEAKISQSKVEGITERQLRRIEQGECRATAGALAALAKAHDLDVNDYMELLTKAMK